MPSTAAIRWVSQNRMMTKTATSTMAITEQEQRQQSDISQEVAEVALRLLPPAPSTPIRHAACGPCPAGPPRSATTVREPHGISGGRDRIAEQQADAGADGDRTPWIFVHVLVGRLGRFLGFFDHHFLVAHQVVLGAGRVRSNFSLAAFRSSPLSELLRSQLSASEITVFKSYINWSRAPVWVGILSIMGWPRVVKFFVENSAADTKPRRCLLGNIILLHSLARHRRTGPRRASCCG